MTENYNHSKPYEQIDKVDFWIDTLSKYRKLSFEMQYLFALKNCLDNGLTSTDRTGTGTLRSQSETFHIDMKNNKFPILRGKKMFPKLGIVEALWMFNGDTNTKFLKDNGVNYWDNWADENGDLGAIYGAQIRNFNGNIEQLGKIPTIDQLKNVIDLINNNPDNRRIIISLWNPSELGIMNLPACHVLYQFCVTIDKDGQKQLDLHVIQRSADSFLGVPYDYILFATMMRIVSFITKVPCNMMHYTCNDFHIYVNHVDQVNQYIQNVLKNIDNNIYNDSYLDLTNIPDFNNIDDFLNYTNNNMKNIMEIFKITGYSSNEAIKAQIAV